VIIYRDQSHVSRKTPPAWLEGAANLQVRESAEGRLWGIGSPLVIQPAKRWHDMDDGWQVGVVEAVDPRELLRDLSWATAKPVVGINGIVWMAPEILTPMGARAYTCPYGKNWIPQPTEPQTACEEVAKAAREALLAGFEAIDGEAQLHLSVPDEALCQWAAVLLSTTHYISPEALAVLGLMDQGLAIQTILIATSIKATAA
jgi:hypothetical protein